MNIIEEFFSTQIERLAIELASRAYLYEPLPSNYQEMPEQNLLEYIENHLWAQLEYSSANVILETIENDILRKKELFTRLAKGKYISEDNPDT